MPDTYFSRPCPACGGRVRHRDGCDYAECCSCGKRFRLKQNTQKNVGSSRGEKQSGEPHSLPEKLLSALKRFWNGIKARALALYRTLYRAVRKKNDRIPLPKPPAEEATPKTAPEPPMDEGQRALYSARKKQLEARAGEALPQPEPTRSERLEHFVTTHRGLSIAIASTVLAILLILMTVGITFCVLESQINKSDFTFLYGTEGFDEVTDSRTYAFVTNNGKALKINMNALADLCELTRSGIRSAPKYAVSDGTSYVKFKVGSSIALVNGKNYDMNCTAEYDEDGNLWVDLYFADDILGGVTVTFDPETNTVTATRNTTPESTVLSPVYETVMISAGNRTVSTQSSGIVSTDNITYKTDVSAYTADFYPTDPSYLILANKQNPLSADYAPNDLTLTNESVLSTRAVRLRLSAARALEAMFEEMKAEGVTDVSITSSYRDYAYQEYLFEKYVIEEMAKGLSESEAIALVETYSSRPGYSEHQTGLCVDFWTSTMTDLTNEQFENTEASQWLRDNAWKFGFILRYPSDKVDITGYSYESWHYRFVGVDAAAEIRANGWCFEEYLAEQ